MLFCQQRWMELTDRLRMGSDDYSEEYQKLQSAYGEKHRAYHTVQHISECLEKLDWVSAGDNRDSLARIEMALWYHDVVYSPRGTNNERHSADLCAQFLHQAGVSAAVKEVVYNMILATRHSGRPGSAEEQLVVDIDLSILGADENRFTEYEAQIRREYKWVPWFMYKNKRRELLQGFLNRPRLFSTKSFYDAYEERARNNILGSILRLS